MCTRMIFAAVLSPTIKIFHRYLGPNLYICTVKVSAWFHRHFTEILWHFTAKKHWPSWFRAKSRCAYCICVLEELSRPWSYGSWSSNHDHGKVYSIQHYVIKVCQWFATGQWFSPGTPVSSTNIKIKTDCNDIAEILLKVADNPIQITL